MKFWKTIIALVAACFCDGEMETMGQETLTVQYTEEDGSFHTLLVEEDVEFLDFEGSSLTNLTLPAGLSNLKELNLIGNRLTGLILPEGLSSLKTLDLTHNFYLASLTLLESLPSLETLKLRGNRLTNLVLPAGLRSLELLGIRDLQLTNLTLPEGLSSLENIYLHKTPLSRLLVPYRMNTDDLTIHYWYDGNPQTVSRLFAHISTDGPFRIEYYRTPQLLSMRRLEDGIEIVWDEGTLQSAPSIAGPWQDVASDGTVRRLFRSSLPAEFFRVKP